MWKVVLPVVRGGGAWPKEGWSCVGEVVLEVRGKGGSDSTGKPLTLSLFCTNC